MEKMLTFDSFTLIPTYSDINSRNEVNLSTKIKTNQISDIKFNSLSSELPIINANMHSICTPEMIHNISNIYNSFSSYHRFFKTMNERKNALKTLSEYKQKMFVSLGAKSNEYDFFSYMYDEGFKNIIIDVNHGHHKNVEKFIKYIKSNSLYDDVTIMAGNVSSIDGIKFLRDAGATIIKIGNSFGFSCTTLKASGFGVHPIHTAKQYRETTGDYDTILCLDGGIKEVADIAKSLIWVDMVMIGKILAGCDESNSKKICLDGNTFYKEYYGNASIKTKQIDEENHVRYIEGTTTCVPYSGPVNKTLTSIKEGLQSAFSFVGARNLSEYQIKAAKQILYI